MEKDHYIGLIILLGIIAIALFGGAKNAKNSSGFFVITPPVQTQEQKDAEIKKEEINKTHSKYFGLVKIQNLYNTNDPATEYLLLGTPYDSTTTISITGWTLKSAWTGQSVTVPKATILYFSGTTNIENDNVILYPGDMAHISTGNSPIISSFRVNKCSGYLTQFKTFSPYLSTYCPLARNEDLSSIPRRIENDNCFDLINNYPSCRTQTENLPITYSYECTKFIAEKMNYNSCISTHKDDKDFYQKDWRIYLKRSQEIWTNSNNEEIVLYDNIGKIVDDYKVH